jgi:hypothetical protein
LRLVSGDQGLKPGLNGSRSLCQFGSEAQR